MYIAQRTDYYPFGSPFSTENHTFKFLYQGKEYVDFLGLNQYDFHARGLDTWNARFSGVDPVDNVSLSGYASMNNNPLSYIDPDGHEPIAIGFMIGIFANTISKMAQNKPINNIWQFISPGIVGAVGAGVGGAVLGSFSPMATSGAGSFGSTVGAYAASGAASGFVSGGLSAAFNGENIGRGAMFGALSGGAFGGMSGGIQYSSAHDYLNNLPALAQNGDPIYRGGNLDGVTVKGFRYGLNPAHSGAIQPNYFFEGQFVGGAIFKPLMSQLFSWGGGLLSKGAGKGGVELTAHGAERIAGAAATRGGVLTMEGVNATRSLGRTFAQSDGANVFLHEITPGRFNAVIQNQTTGKVITTMNNWSLKSINRIGKNYGWPIQ